MTLPYENTTPRPEPDVDLLNLELPIAVRVGGGIFGRGVKLRTVANQLARIANYSQELKDRMSKQSIQCKNDPAPDVAELVEALRQIIGAIAAHDDGGGFFVEHHGPDGEYLGWQPIDPVSIVQEVVSIAHTALAKHGGAA